MSRNKVAPLAFCFWKLKVFLLLKSFQQEKVIPFEGKDFKQPKFYCTSHPINFFAATEHRMNLRPICKFEFCHCGPVEKTLERSTCPALVVAAWQSRVGSKFPNLKILNFLHLPQNFTTNQGLHSKFPHPTPRMACQCPYAKEMRWIRPKFTKLELFSWRR